MPSNGVHHVDLVVSSIERSLPFYRELLGPLGYTRIGEVEGERGETIWYLGGVGCAVGLREAQSEGTSDRYRIGLHHVAFNASSRELVDERHEWLVEVGVEIESDAARVRLHPGLLRGLLLRPGRDQARDRPRAAARACRRLAPWIGLRSDCGRLALLPDDEPAVALGDDVSRPRGARGRARP